MIAGAFGNFAHGMRFGATTLISGDCACPYLVRDELACFHQYLTFLIVIVLMWLMIVPPLMQVDFASIQSQAPEAES